MTTNENPPEKAAPSPLRRYTAWGLVAVSVAMGLAFIIQNRSSVRLWAGIEVEAPLAFIVLGAVLFGAGLGWAYGWWARRRPAQPTAP